MVILSGSISKVYASLGLGTPVRVIQDLPSIQRRVDQGRKLHHFCQVGNGPLEGGIANRR
jgi:hypothetical protein